MPTSADSDVGRVILGYQAAVAQIRVHVLAYVTQAWRGLGRWDRGDIERFVDLILPQIAAGQVTVAALTDAYLAQLERTVLGTAARTIGVEAASVTTEALRGVAASEVYQRPGVTVWRALSEGVPYDRAVGRGLDRALTMAGDDLQLAKTHVTRDVMASNPRIVGYRRVLKGPKSCVLCITASTQRYEKEQLMPIHGRCDCSVVPVWDTEDPGRVLNSALLLELKRSGLSGDLSLRQAASRSRESIELADRRLEGLRQEIAEESDPTRRERLETRVESWQERRKKSERQLRARERDLKKYRADRPGQPNSSALITHEHGELGPVLAIRGQAFTGPSDI